MSTLVWDERLITRERAVNLCATWQLTTDGSYLRCGTCDGNVSQFPTEGRVFDIDGLIGQVLGHMVKCHNYSLSGNANG